MGKLCLVLLYIVSLNEATHGLTQGKFYRDLEHDQMMSASALGTVLPENRSIESVTTRHPDFLKLYEDAYHDCVSVLNGIQQDDLKSTYRNQAPGTKGSFFQYYGLLFHEFGPKQCLIHSKCWISILSCGELNVSRVTSDFQKDNTRYNIQNKDRNKNSFERSNFEYSPRPQCEPTPAFNQWTLKAVYTLIRIFGLETIVPSTSLVFSDPSLSPIPHMLIEAIFAEYTVAIPGNYSIEVRPLRLYPGVMLNFTELEKNRGCDILHSKLLFTRDQFVTSFAVIAYVDGDKNETHNAYMSRKNLDYCVNGNNPGRWLRFPNSLLNTCGASPFIRTMSVTADDDKKSIKLSRQYTNIIQKSSSDKNALNKLKSMLQNADSIESKLYYSELLRYADGSICSLVFLENPHVGFDGFRLEVFAPYTCKYRLIGKEEGESCLKKTSDHQDHYILFHGDSMSRDLYGEVLRRLDRLSATRADLKNLDHYRLRHHADPVPNPFTSFSQNVRVDFKSTWNPLSGLNALEAPFPQSYYSNFAIAHMTDVDMTALRETIGQSDWVQFWNAHYDNITTLSRIKRRVYLSAKSTLVHDAEQILRRNSVVRKLFVDKWKFLEQDEYLYTIGKLDDLHDGWHYGGVSRKMSAVIALNVLCADFDFT